MKKAIIATGGKQYVVYEDQTLEVELLGNDKKIEFIPLLVINDKEVKVGTPKVTGAKVTAEIVEEQKLDDKVVAIRYKAKKRVKKVHGHRQRKAVIKITKIA